MATQDFNAPTAPDRPTASVYIDGLNLYRQKLEFHPDLKWLNIVKLCELMLPTHDITRVRYFSARVKESVSDKQGPIRQTNYWRALQTLEPTISMHFGKMRSDPRHYRVIPLAIDELGLPVRAKVQKIEEKGSDVALASYMVFDAATEPSDMHILLSSDSDFEPALNLIRREMGITTGLFSPIEVPSRSLMQTNPDLVKIVRRSFLENAQFPNQLQDAEGDFHRPEEWQ